MELGEGNHITKHFRTIESTRTPRQNSPNTTKRKIDPRASVCAREGWALAYLITEAQYLAQDK